MVMDACKTPEIPIFKGHEEFLNPYEYEHHHYGLDGFGGFQTENKEKIQLNNLKEESAVDFLIRSAK
jgi:hypothetical protein